MSTLSLFAIALVAGVIAAPYLAAYIACQATALRSELLKAVQAMRADLIFPNF